MKQNLDLPHRALASRSDAALARFVGSRLQRRRQALGMGRDVLAAKAGLSVGNPALQEEGDLRLPADKLWALATALGVPLQYFFMEEKPALPAAEREVGELESAYRRIRDPRLRQLAVDGVLALASVK
jgi:transcriptional regulator with XRE-family HTH domain